MNRSPFCLLLLMAAVLPVKAQKNLLQKLLQRNPQHFQKLLDKPEEYDLQIIYTQVDRDAANFPHFKSFVYQLDKKQYFYPASTVKMPTAFLALEKINRLKIRGLDKYSTMKTGAARPPQTSAQTDPSAANGLPSVAHYIKKVFLVSDNDAHNRLYEFLGQQQLNEALWAKGYHEARIVHRLGILGFDAEANCYTNPVGFWEGEQLLYFQGEVYSRADRHFQLEKVLRGHSHYEGEELVSGPFDFSKKNYISLQCLHDILKAIIFPQAVAPSQRFDLTADDYRFLLQVMSEMPGESRFPAYQKPDHYVKFLIFGNQKEGERIPENIRIFNKVGWAYGFMTDVAYIVDFGAGIEFFLAATIRVNENGIADGEEYEYETVGLPFFANLGKVVYEHEKKRKRKYRPDLSTFKVEKYD